MAITAQTSTQIANAEASPDVKNPVSDFGGKLRFARFDFTQSGIGDAGSTVDLVRLGGGRVRVFPVLSRLIAAAFGAARTLDIGHTGFTQLDGTVVAAAVNAVEDNLNVTAATDGFLGASAVALTEVEYESKGEIVIQAVVAGGTIPDATTLSGWIAYVTD